MPIRLHTPDGTVLMEVQTIEPDGEALLIRGTIMGSMPLKAHLRRSELRRGVAMLRWRTIVWVLRALLRG